MSNARLVVNEIFGPTIQGEGPSLGQFCFFLRLAGCNLACTWCDTKYAWDFQTYRREEEAHPMSCTDVLQQLLGLSRRYRDRPGISLVCTGGEPVLQQSALVALIERLAGDYGWLIEIETAGTRLWQEPLKHITRFNVSPKLAHSGNAFDKRFIPDVLEAYRDTGIAVFKFVVQNLGQLDEVEEIVEAVNIPDRMVWIMPEGTTAQEVLTNGQVIVQEAIERGWNVTTRLHTLLWGKSRGR